MALWLNERDVQCALPLPALIDATEQALIAYSSGRAVQPLRSVLELPRGVMGCMPGVLSAEGGVAGLKLVTVCPENREKRLPSHLATILLLDAETGELRAVLDGRFITEMRTAAASAVAARCFARKDARVLAIIGSGVQARSHLEVLTTVRSFQEIRCWSRTKRHAEDFAADWGRFGVRAVESAKDAVDEADVVGLVSAATEPVVEDAWVKAGALVLAVGACRPNERELDLDLLAGAQLYVDSREGALAESGDILEGLRQGRFGPEHILAEVGEAAAGEHASKELNRKTVFKSLGMAVEDLAAAQLAYARARDLGIGTELP